MYSVEQQALAQLVSAPKLAGDPALAEAFRQHYTETEQQAELVRARLEAHGGSPSVIKDAVMKLGGKGFLLFAGTQPETPGKLTAHAYSYEAMEWAGYEMLARFAQIAGDAQTAAVAQQIGAEERAMMERLESGFDAAESVSHADTPPKKLADHLATHLAEAHALEQQGIQLLSKGEKIAGNEQMAQFYREQLEETRNHVRMIEERLAALGTDASTLKDSALGLAGLNWTMFFQAQSDTAAKLAAFAYAFEHLKIAGYELLLRTARRASDAATVSLCERILAAERTMAERLANSFDQAAQATLEAVAS